MKSLEKAVLVSVLVFAGAVAVCRTTSGQAVPATEASGPVALSLESDGRMRFPANYREWVFLSSGFNISYSQSSSPKAEPGAQFDNVFVDPAAYRAFKRSGEWPDGTVLILEIRNGSGSGSINKSGHFQADVNHVEAHVKDRSRFPGGWAFFGFTGQESGTLLPKTASCYSCHEQHGAVDTTFVQFYPTLNGGKTAAVKDR